MPPTADRDDKKYSGAIIWATLLTVSYVVYFFYNGWSKYSTPDSFWLILLFAIPPLGQSITYLIVYFKARSDKSVLTFYYFCLLTNIIATLTYCVLWTRYMSQDYRQANSYYALGIILFLLVPVGLMTYVIMWTPNKGVLHRYYELKKDQIDWGKFYTKVIATSGGGDDIPDTWRALTRKIRKGVLQALNKEGPNETIPNNPSGAEQDRAVAALNYIITDPEFHEEYFHGVELGEEAEELLSRRRRSLTDREVQRLNRLLIDNCIGHACYLERKADSEEGTESPWKRRWKKRWPARVMKWENLLADLKDGCAKSPFWAVVFFFTVFLAITYLFGFGFAFHDKSRTDPPPPPASAGTKQQNAGSVATNAGKTPALYRPKSLPTAEQEQEQEQTAATATPTPAAVPAPSPYTFYFAPYSAVLNYKYRPFDEEASYTPKQKSGAWRARKNYEHFTQLVGEIEAASANGLAVSVRVLGGTDAEPARQVNYASNYELSEARAQNVKYILMSMLSGKAQHDTEWFCLPQSAESPRPPLSEQDGQNLEASPLPDGKGQPSLGPTPVDSQTRAALSRLASLRNEFNTTPVLSQHRYYLDPRFTRLENLIEGKSLSPKEANELLDKIEAVMSRAKEPGNESPASDGKQAQATQSKQKVEIGGLDEAKELDESLTKAEVYASYVDESSRRRTVEVSLETVKINPQDGPLTLKDYADSQSYSRLSLMDYMYFTIYTITTTGYGDIVPTTSYAKFLCSFANILEVFFFVVFFNALLTVREGRIGRGALRRTGG